MQHQICEHSCALVHVLPARTENLPARTENLPTRDSDTYSC